MNKRYVLLVCPKQLFGESLELVLRKADDLELIGPMELNEEICDLIPELNIDVVVFADEDHNSEGILKLANMVMRRYPDLPVIRTGLTHNMFYIVETHALPARGSDLIETIRGLSAVSPDRRGHDGE